MGRVESGEWRVGSGSGEWGVGFGEWRVGSGKNDGKISAKSWTSICYRYIIPTIPTFCAKKLSRSPISEARGNRR